MIQHREPYMLSEDTSLLCQLELDSRLKSYATSFLLYGGILAGHCDGHFTLEELAYLSESLSPLFDTPETLIYALLSPDSATEPFWQTISWLKVNGDEIKISLLRYLSGIMTADHMLRPAERRFIQNITRELGIPSEEGQQILSEAIMARSSETARRHSRVRQPLPIFAAPERVQAPDSCVAS
ncbi:MAG: hypothetical protein JXR76_10520 [Deltaproteobacteria bacterium]|nr:hypothetical protein [Deltaproteobacteria bacterium]